MFSSVGSSNNLASLRASQRVHLNFFSKEEFMLPVVEKKVRITPLSITSQAFSRTSQGLFKRDQVTSLGTCENRGRPFATTFSNTAIISVAWVFQRV
jgi:hypothetical protein